MRKLHLIIVYVLAISACVASLLLWQEREILKTNLAGEILRTQAESLVLPEPQGVGHIDETARLRADYFVLLGERDEALRQLMQARRRSAVKMRASSPIMVAVTYNGRVHTEILTAESEYVVDKSGLSLKLVPLK